MLETCGVTSLLPEASRPEATTIYDLASLTKVLATTLAVLKLIDKKVLDLERPLHWCLPEMRVESREPIRLKHLLTHSSGFVAGLSPGKLKQRLTDHPSEPRASAQAIQLILETRLLGEPGTVYTYSDINFLLLGWIVERWSNQSLKDYCQKEIFDALGLKSTSYVPPQSWRSRIAPTTWIDEENRFLCGEVHDPISRYLGGITGHAGVFSCAEEVAVILRAIMAKEECIFSKNMHDLMRKVASPPNLPKRSLGWDMDSPYARQRGALFKVGGVGHTGFTGTSVWMDFETETFMITLSNRVHPDGQGNSIPMQKEMGSIAAFAAGLGSEAELQNILKNTK